MVSTSDLPGGMANHMTVLELAMADGSAHRLVVRRGQVDQGQFGLRIEQEFELLQFLRRQGLAVPVPRHCGRRSFGAGIQAFSVLDFVDGAMLLGSDQPEQVGRSVAEVLVGVHDIDVDLLVDLHLPRTIETLDRLLVQGQHAAVDLPGEWLIRQALDAHGSAWMTGDRHLVHGDFWPGNLLWRADKLVAVIDWQGAGLGDPLWDVAIARLDLWWTYGRRASEAFTERYFDAAQRDRSALPLWDLLAAMRPVGNLQAWVDDWTQLGRPDLTVGVMAQVHELFVRRALGAL